MLPIITVAVPTRNRPQFLIRSVRSILNQSYQNFELLILDNGSDDLSWRESPDFADSRVRVICHTANIGVVNNWNAAIREAKGEAICIFHDDDTMEPMFLETMVKMLADAPSAGLLFSLARCVDCLGNDLGVYWTPSRTGVITGYEYILLNLQFFSRVTLPAGVIITRKAYDTVGPYTQEVSESSFDTNYYLRVAMKFDVCIVDKVLVNYTIHPSQISWNIWLTGDTLDGFVDASLEILNAASWMLDREELSREHRCEIAGVVRKCMKHIRKYSAAKSPSHQVF